MTDTERARPTLLVYLLLLAVTAIWGAVFPMLRHVNALRAPYGITSWDIVWLRFIPSTLLLLPLLWAKRHEVVDMLRVALWPILAVGTLTCGAYNYFLITGEEKVPGAVASLIIGLNPSTTFLLSVMFLGEHFTRRKLFGLVVSMAGLAWISFAGKSSTGSGLDIRYVLLTMLAPASWATATVISKAILNRKRSSAAGGFDSLTVTALSIALGTIPLLPLPWIQGKLFQNYSKLPPVFWWELAYMVVLATVLGFLVWYRALHGLRATQVAMFVFMVPLFGVLISGFTEGVTLRVLAGGAAIIAGVVITNTGNARRE